MKLFGAIVAVAASAGLALAAGAPAKSPEVVRRGSCTGATEWKLKLSPENGRIEVEFEVDQNVAGRRWRIRLFRDGRLVFDRVLTTRAPSGSLEVRRLVANPAGPDVIRARGRSLRTGELCSSSATARF